MPGVVAERPDLTANRDPGQAKLKIENLAPNKINKYKRDAKGYLGKMMRLGKFTIR
jgi:hypothetical protein